LMQQQNKEKIKRKIRKQYMCNTTKNKTEIITKKKQNI